MSRLDDNTFGREPFLRAVRLLREMIPHDSCYPFNLGVVRQLSELQFHPAVTYIVGENGAGKSTLMEGIAVAWGFNAEGGTRNNAFSTQATHSSLYNYLRLVRSTRQARDGFFFRAESYYNLATHIDELDMDELDAVPGPKIKDAYGGKSLHEQSHGESFFAAFVHRFRGNGLYILDEPEAALSPLRQMAMLTRIHQLVRQGSQFIISTHSPIIMAYPQSWIYKVDQEGLNRCSLEETDHYIVTKEFMNNRERMLGELLDDEDE
ncbi:AAA family ATPase [Paenibacillus massiliensis]|uniref:AAA family ATPase n=1 Tax=Paenibacillus massiliensis TaxID=225917 RepID=UPI000381D709